MIAICDQFPSDRNAVIASVDNLAKEALLAFDRENDGPQGAWVGPTEQRELVLSAFQTWSDRARRLRSTRVSVDDREDAEIRIGCDSSDGSWTHLGGDEIEFGSHPNERTLDTGYEPDGWDTALQTIGHTLGLALAHGGNLEPEAWGRIREHALRSAARHGSRYGWDGHIVEDVAQEALLRLWTAVRAGDRIRAPLAWVERVVRYIALDAARGRRRALGPAPGLRLDERSIEEIGCDSTRDPDTAVVLSDLWASAPTLFARLPPPCREIATLQYERGWSRKDIVSWLLDWRDVGEEEARRMIKRSHALLRCLGRSREPDSLWPTGWNREKNRWLTTPPPGLRDVKAGKPAPAKQPHGPRPRRTRTCPALETVDTLERWATHRKERTSCTHCAR